MEDDVVRRRLAEHLVNLPRWGMSEDQIAVGVELLLKERAPEDKISQLILADVLARLKVIEACVCQKERAA